LFSKRKDQLNGTLQFCLSSSLRVFRIGAVRAMDIVKYIGPDFLSSPNDKGKTTVRIFNNDRGIL
jgi:hypothetical protein